MEFRNLLNAASRQRPLLGVALLVLVGIVALFWIFAALADRLDSDYLRAIVPTMAGVLASAPIAYWAIRVGQDAELESDSRRRTFVLLVIRAELESAMEELRGERAARPRPLLFPDLRTEAWDRLTAGTDLRLLGEPAFVGQLARAYYRIKAMNALEHRWMSTPNELLVGDQIYTGDRLRDALERSDVHTIAAIDDALAAIHDQVDPHGPPYVGSSAS